MNRLIATWPRRAGLSIVTWIFVASLMLLLAMHLDEVSPAQWGLGDWMKRIVIVPGLLAFIVLLATTMFVRQTAYAAPSGAPKSNLAAAAPTEDTKPSIAQVVGLIWLNPLQRRDYPTEWQLLWTQGFVSPNKNDDMVRTDPKSFKTLQSVASVAYGNKGAESFKGFYYKYVDKSLLLLRTRYATNPTYFYTVNPADSKEWRELAGVRIELAIPPRLDREDARARLRDRMVNFFEIGPPSPKTLWTRDTPPDVQVTQGGANAGFTSLNKALDYLQANPDKSVWVMNWDAPSFPPRDAQINENLVVLFLAGPNFNTEREPLAWIGKSATSDTREFEAKAGTTRAVQAWKAAIEKASHNANIAVSDIQYVVHDAGKGSDSASARLAALSQTLTEVLPEYDYGKQTFNTTALLGDMGTGSALTDVALAIGRINHFGGNALIAGTTDAQHPVAVVVTPPPKLTPINPDKDWFRARGENNAYLPWWGRRHDARAAMQGYSE